MEVRLDARVREMKEDRTILVIAYVGGRLMKGEQEAARVMHLAGLT